MCECRVGAGGASCRTSKRLAHHNISTIAPTDSLTSALVLRVLYRFRTLSEQSPFDGPTFSYLSPLLTRVVESGTEIGESDEDELLERIALVIDITNFHSANCELAFIVCLHRLCCINCRIKQVSDLKFPRAQTLQNLLHIIKKYPSIGKDASSVLIGLGEAIHVNASPDETSVLVKNTIAAEVYVRNSALQCLQVR